VAAAHNDFSRAKQWCFLAECCPMLSSAFYNAFATIHSARLDLFVFDSYDSKVKNSFL
jgi:hypothetical protein